MCLLIGFSSVKEVLLQVKVGKPRVAVNTGAAGNLGGLARIIHESLFYESQLPAISRRSPLFAPQRTESTPASLIRTNTTISQTLEALTTSVHE
jgi:hypothetical protein